MIFHNGKIGETYNIGGNNEMTNIEIINKIIEFEDELLNRPKDNSKKFISFVAVRLSHDQRYGVDSSKLQRELGWKPEADFNKHIKTTIEWYVKKYKMK